MKRELHLSDACQLERIACELNGDRGVIDAVQFFMIFGRACRPASVANDCERDQVLNSILGAMAHPLHVSIKSSIMVLKINESLINYLLKLCS